MPQDDKSGVEKLKDALYSRKRDIEPQDIRTPLVPVDSDVPPVWKESEVSEDAPKPILNLMRKKIMSLPTKFFLSSVAFFVLAMGVAAFVFFGGSNLISPQNIDMQIVAPSLIDGGKDALFQINIINRNQTELQLVDLIIDYPDGTRSSTDPSKTLSHERQTIGTIASGQAIKKTASGIFYGQEGSQQKIIATLEYGVPGSNAVFQKKTEADFTIGSSPVSITVDAPSEAIAGDTLAMNVTIRSNAPTAINNVVLQGQYPFGFSITGAVPAADAGGTLWRLGTMQPGSSQTIHLTGQIQGQDGDERVFRFIAGSNTDQTDTQIKMPLLSMPYTLTVHKPFISGAISVEGKSGTSVSVAAGKQLSGMITWKNNLTDAISDVELTLSFAGPALDKNSINGQNGFYQSSGPSIIWSKDQDASLGTIPPGGSGTYQFSFATLPAAAGNILVTNPTVSLNLEVRGTRQSSTSVPEKISSVAKLQVQLASNASITAQSSHFSGPFVNIGPMPPRAESATTYSVVWTVKNSSSALANTNATAVLPPYVQFVSAVTGEGVTYDAASRTVRWPIGELKAGVGYTLAARQAAFQVTLTPSTSQIGQAPVLTGPVTLSGLDRFAQVQVESQGASPTTRITGEAGITAGMDIVGPKQ